LVYLSCKKSFAELLDTTSIVHVLVSTKEFICCTRSSEVMVQEIYVSERNSYRLVDALATKHKPCTVFRSCSKSGFPISVKEICVCVFVPVSVPVQI
jgi:hypothetical protein